jgi:signal transduction histidine kinase
VHLPIRLRLTLAFAASMACLLAAAGTFLYARLGAELLNTSDAALRAQAAVVSAGLGGSGTNFGDPEGGPGASGGQFAQVLDPSGRILESSQVVAGVRIVTAQDLSRVIAPTFFERAVPNVEGIARLLVMPAGDPGKRRFVLIGSSLRGRSDVLSRFLFVLVVGGPIALSLASTAGWLLAGAALSPVERARREAAAISVSDLDHRLPVPRSRDEVARLVTTLNEMLARLQEAFDGERRFVVDASHELRTPLTILKAELDLALARARTSEEMGRALHSASDEADRLVSLAEDLLVYSRSVEGRVPVHRNHFRLDELLGQACAGFREKARVAGVRLAIEAPPEPVRLDGSRARQAVDNVLDNAIRHTPPGGHVQVTGTLEKDRVRIVVDDSGAGFPIDFMEHAFEPFARASEERASSSDGSGLGLAIVEAIAQAHGGCATVENRPGGGARITIVLGQDAAPEPHPRFISL